MIMIIVVVVIWSGGLFVRWLVCCLQRPVVIVVDARVPVYVSPPRGGGIKNLELGIESGRKKQHVEGLGWGRGEGRGLELVERGREARVGWLHAGK